MAYKGFADGGDWLKVLVSSILVFFLLWLVVGVCDLKAANMTYGTWQEIDNLLIDLSPAGDGTANLDNADGCPSGAEPTIGVGTVADETIAVADLVKLAKWYVTTQNTTGANDVVEIAGYFNDYKAYVVKVTSDTDNQALTIYDTDNTPADNTRLFIVNWGSNTITFTDVPGQQELGGFLVLEEYEGQEFMYLTDRWIAYNDPSNISFSTYTLGKLYINATLDANADHAANGKFLYGFVHGETVAAMKCVFLATDGKVDNADANVVGEYETCIGLSVNGGALDSAADILTEGILRDDTFTFTAGDPIYLSEDGAGSITATAPLDSTDCVKIIGIARSDDEVYFNFTNHYVLVD